MTIMMMNWNDRNHRKRHMEYLITFMKAKESEGEKFNATHPQQDIRYYAFKAFNCGSAYEIPIENVLQRKLYMSDDFANFILENFWIDGVKKSFNSYTFSDAIEFLEWIKEDFARADKYIETWYKKFDADNPNVKLCYWWDYER